MGCERFTQVKSLARILREHNSGDPNAMACSGGASLQVLLKRAFRSAWMGVRANLCRYPWTFELLVRLRSRRYGPLVVSRRTSVVIEGFPRSANTFAVAAFWVAQGNQEIHVGRHTHAPAQVMRAANAGIPTVVLVRHPRDAVVSYVIREGITVREALRQYVLYYHSIWGLREHFAVAKFSDVTDDFGRIIGHLNRDFGTSFAEFDSDGDSLGRALALVEALERSDSGGVVRDSHVARPSRLRNGQAEELKGVYAGPKLARIRRRAECLFEAYCRYAEQRENSVGWRERSAQR